MLTKQLHRALPLFLSAVALSPAAWALGLGAGPTSVVLGQPLDFAVTARLAADESLSGECVQAEVLVGEQRVSSDAVRVRVQASGSNSASVRVSTSMSIDEPVVTVNLSVGCGTRVSRRYVVFADPGPAAGPQAPVVALVPAATVAAPYAATASDAAPGTAGLATASVPPQGDAPRPRASDSVRPSPPRSTRRPAQRSDQTAAAPRQRSRPARTPTAALQAAAPRAEARPRLQLEPDEVRPMPPPPTAEVIEAAFAAVEQAASAARAAASAASASAERIATLERSLEKVRTESQAHQLEVDRLRALLSRPQPSSAWLLPLLALLAAVSLAAAWLVWRLRAMQRAQEVAWARASAPVAPDVPSKETAPLPLITSELTMPPPVIGRGLVANEGPRTTQPGILDIADTTIDDEDHTLDRAMARTVVMPPSARVDEGAPRDVSIEELIDLEQQAEFFIALGQDNAAVDLLVAHLRNTGGGSPLTYLKLLEIYRRLDDQPAYERTRSRFNYRYNAYAPEWGVDLQTGRALEDYPGVLPRLEQAWSRPLDAMAELEALLFRKSRGELFELPAYRDVLFLYSLARDLHERDPKEVTDVDLLLPLDAAGAAPVGAANSRRADLDIALDERPTAPIDLDLTPQASHESIFGEPLTPSPGFGRKPPSRL